MNFKIASNLYGGLKQDDYQENCYKLTFDLQEMPLPSKIKVTFTPYGNPISNPFIHDAQNEKCYDVYPTSKHTGYILIPRILDDHYQEAYLQIEKA